MLISLSINQDVTHMVSFNWVKLAVFLHVNNMATSSPCCLSTTSYMNSTPRHLVTEKTVSFTISSNLQSQKPENYYYIRISARFQDRSQRSINEYSKFQLRKSHCFTHGQYKLAIKSLALLSLRRKVEILHNKCSISVINCGC